MRRRQIVRHLKHVSCAELMRRDRSMTCDKDSRPRCLNGCSQFLSFEKLNLQVLDRIGFPTP